MRKHVDFEIPAFGEFGQPPIDVPGYSSLILAQSAVRYWPLDDATVGSFHERIAGNDAVASGDITADQPGPIEFDQTATAVEFGATTSEASVPWSGIVGGSARTSTCWILNPSGATGSFSFSIINWGLVNGQDGAWWHVGVNNTSSNGPVGRLRLSVVGGYRIGTTDLQDGNWHHIAAVLEDSSLTSAQLYVDGLHETIAGLSGTPTIQTAAGPDTYISRATPESTGVDRFGGAMSQCAVFDRALTADEIRLQYETGVGR